LDNLTYVNLVKRISFMFFVLTLLSSLSAAIFVNININLASAKISSHSSGGDSNDISSGNIVNSNGYNGNDSSGRTTPTPSTDQGNTGLSSTTLSATTTTPTAQQQQPDSSNCNTKFMIECSSIKPNNTTSTTTTTTTPTAQQQQPDSSNCNTKFMIGCVTGGSVQCIVAPCGPSSTTSTNAGALTPQQQYQQCLSGIGGGIPGNCKPPSSTTTSTNNSAGTLNNAGPLTPQQQYQQCLSGIGGGIPGNCKPPSSTTTSEQNFAPQTLNPQKCQLLPTDANGNCQRINMQDGRSGLPPSQLGSQEKQAHYDLPYEVTHVKQLPDGSCPADYHYSTNSSSDRYCLINVSLKNPDGSCPVGLIMTTNNECVKMPVLPGTSTGSTGGGFIQMFPTHPATSPPATSPNNTSPYLPPPSTK
jgi:hypothetical protein